MKDRASGSIGRRLIWSGRVVFIGRDAAFEGVIANAVTAGSTVSPIVPRRSRSGPGTGRSGTGSKSYATPGVGVDAGQGVRGTAAAHMPSDNGAAIAFLRGDYDQLLRISCNGWRSRDRPPPAYESHSPRTIFSPTEGDNPSARVRQGQ